MIYNWPRFDERLNLLGERHAQVSRYKPRWAERGGGRPGATAAGPAGRVVMVSHVGSGRMSLERRGRVVHGHRLVRQHDVRVWKIQRTWTSVNCYLRQRIAYVIYKNILFDDEKHLRPRRRRRINTHSGTVKRSIFYATYRTICECTRHV